MSGLNSGMDAAQGNCPLCHSSSWTQSPDESVFALINRCTGCNFQRRHYSGISFASQIARPAPHALNKKLGFKHGQPGRRCLRFGWSPAGAVGAIQTELWSGLEIELDCPERETIEFCVQINVIAAKQLRYVNFHAQDRFVGGVACSAEEQKTFSAEFPLPGIACGRRFVLDVEMVPEDVQSFKLDQSQYALEAITCTQVVPA